ncbi:MAG TPA: DUF2339 domain-containing protein [Terracidiphilus sp.]|nr:DUF2339 domain-containing protein [Terracidiphilus sp.]
MVLVAGVVALIALPIAAMVASRSTARELREQMAVLMSRIGVLEARLHQMASERVAAPERPAAQPAPAQAPQISEAPPVTAASPVAATPAPETNLSPTPPPIVPAPVTASPAFHALDHAGPAETRSLESRIGSQWFNRVGILAVLIAVAWFLKLAFDNHWIGPLGRVLIGLLAGAGLITWSERFQKRGFAVFGYSLKAIGSGTLYLSLWAAFSVYALLPAWAAFGAMILVTAFNGVIAWVRDAELLALYAIAGGLSTPLLVSTGGNHEIALFTYLLILDVAVLVLVALKPWSRLLFAAFTGTAVFIGGWWSEFYTLAQQGRTAFFLICFFLIFAVAPRLVRVQSDEHISFSGWDVLALILLPILNAALGFLAFYSLFFSAMQDWAGPWLAVAFAAFYLLLLRLPARGVLAAGPSLLAALHLSAAVVFLTIAIPLKTHGRWLTIGWIVEGAALLWLSSRLRQMLVRVFALVCLVLGLGALLVVNPPASTTPIFNTRFGTYAVAIAVFAFIAWLARHAGADEAAKPIVGWPFLAGASVLVINGLILLAIGWEIHSYWWSRRWHYDWRVFRDYTIYAHFSYSAFFMIFGAVLLSIGFWRRSAFLRWQALVLLAVTIAKVFLVDTSQLSQGFRVFSFLGLGVLLLAVSFAYQRDWLNLRSQGDQPQ